jgi:competence protein ComEC
MPQYLFIVATAIVLACSGIGDAASEPARATFSVNRQSERITIRNNTDTMLDVSGWAIVSGRGNQRYIVPRQTAIEPGDALFIASGYSGDLRWANQSVWQGGIGPVALMDATGAMVARR